MEFRIRPWSSTEKCVFVTLILSNFITDAPFFGFVRTSTRGRLTRSVIFSIRQRSVPASRMVVGLPRQKLRYEWSLSIRLHQHVS